MAEYSTQGTKVAFIGLNHTAQIACAEYLRRKRGFKRVNMDTALKRFVRTSYWYKVKQNMDWATRLAFYDAIYRVDPTIFIKYTKGILDVTSADTVIYDVRYLNEMEALKDMGFVICRVTTPVKQLQIGKYVKSAAPGTVAVSLAYDKRFATNHGANYSVSWTHWSDTSHIMDSFLERIGHKLDL